MSTVHFREATFADYDQIAAVQRRNGLRMKPRDYWFHLWQNNPAYKRRAGWPIGWVIETADRGVVGSVRHPA